jgi:hypothetical protein
MATKVEPEIPMELVATSVVSVVGWVLAQLILRLFLEGDRKGSRVESAVRELHLELRELDRRLMRLEAQITALTGHFAKHEANR